MKPAIGVMLSTSGGVWAVEFAILETTRQDCVPETILSVKFGGLAGGMLKRKCDEVERKGGVPTRPGRRGRSYISML